MRGLKGYSECCTPILVKKKHHFYFVIEKKCFTFVLVI